MTHQTAGAPLSINGQNVYRGQDRTNGFLARNVDGRVPAETEGFARLTIPALHPTYADGAVPWGTGLWRDIATIDTKPGTVQCGAPTKGWFVGALKFEQGVQTGHPVLGWGLLNFSKGTLVRKGLLGMKVTMAAVGDEANFLAYLKGDKTKDTATYRKTYDEWIATFKAGADGDRLGMFYANASGFPIIALVLKADVAAPALTGATFAGFVEVLEPENKAVFVNLRAGA